MIRFRLYTRLDSDLSWWEYYIDDVVSFLIFHFKRHTIFVFRFVGDVDFSHFVKMETVRFFSLYKYPFPLVSTKQCVGDSFFEAV